MRLELDKVNTNAGTQVRARLPDDAVVTEYAEAMKKPGNKFPPIIVYDTQDPVQPKRNESPLLLADGFHRLAAARRNESSHIQAEVWKGTREDAIKHALKANTTHGIRRTNDDKRRAVEIALKEWPDLSSAAIARICAVSHTFVENERKHLQPATVAGSTPPKRTGEDGKQRKLPLPKEPKPEKKPVSAVPPPPPPAEAAKAKPENQKDETGYTIPECTLPLWSQGEVEVQAMLTAITKIKSRFAQAEESREPLFSECNLQQIKADLEQLFVRVKLAKPYAVCPGCQGETIKTNCTQCKSRGFVSKFYWKHCVDEETRKLREVG